MPKFDKIDDLLSELFRNRKLFTALFDKRMHHIQEEMVLPLVDNDTDKLERLAAYGLLSRDQSKISLGADLLEFFEDTMEVNETVHVFYIQDHLNQIKTNQSYYIKEAQTRKRDQYLVKIKKHLRRISRITLHNVKTLRVNTDETYKSETNFENKREKLNNIREERDALEGVIKAVERLLRDELFFNTAADEELLMIVHRLRITLNDSFHNLIEIQQQIIEYLNHIEKRVQVVEKVLQLKILRDKHYLKEKTNFYTLVGRNRDLPLKRHDNIRTRLSVAEIISNENSQLLVLKVRQKLKNQKLLAQNISGKIADDAFKNIESKENIVNLPALKTVFMGKNQDLFSFVMQHHFTNNISNTERIRLYCRLASLYEAELNFTNETERFEDLEYALIYPDNN
jgi:hypothetical protein